MDSRADDAARVSDAGADPSRESRALVAPFQDLPRVVALKRLAFVLVVAAVLRAVGLTYQLPVPTGPDHSDLMNVALRMGTGDLNPHMFTWPAAPFYFFAACYGVMFAVCRMVGIVDGVADFKQWFLTDPAAFHLAMRVINVTIGLISVAMLYRLGEELGSRRRGLLAAAILAVTPVDVIFCHYQKAEPLLVLTTILAFLAMVRWWWHDSLARAAWAGAAIGLACAVKYNAVLLVVPAIATWVRHLVASGERRWGRLILGRLVVGMVCVLVVFVVLNPYLILDFSEAWRQLTGQKELLEEGRGGLHATPVRSYIATVFPVSFGWLLYGYFVAGLVWMAAVVRRRGAEVLLLAFVLVYVPVMMSQKLVTVYYVLPAVPALALGASGLAMDLGRVFRPLSWAMVGLLAVPMVRSLQLDYQLALPGPLFRAEYWVRDNIPAGDRIVHRHWLPPQLAVHRYQFGRYVWPLDIRLRREQVESFLERGVTWFVLHTKNVGGHVDELFGPKDSPVAREVMRFEEPRRLLPASAGGITIWKATRSADVPALAEVIGGDAAAPETEIGAEFENGLRLLGVDPLSPGPFEPGEIKELTTYWHVPKGSPRRFLVTGEIRGEGGFLADLTHELAYGITDFVGRPTDSACTVRHRILVRPGYRAKPGAYDVLVGLREIGSKSGATIVDGPGAPGVYCSVARIDVEL